jgi:hypothetical protein
MVPLLLLSCTGAKAQTNDLVLNCKLIDAKYVNIAVVVNFTKKTVSGLSVVDAYISTTDDATIRFEVQEAKGVHFSGTINRMTGSLSTTITISEIKEIGAPSSIIHHQGVCTPTRRVRGQKGNR